MPDQLYKLTFYELQSLYLHKLRQTRERQYAAFFSAWLPNHKEGDICPTIEEYWSLPGDPGWKPPEKKPTLEDHVEFMNRMGEGFP
jgi:hypothetical protein